MDAKVPNEISYSRPRPSQISVSLVLTCGKYFPRITHPCIHASIARKDGQRLSAALLFALCLYTRELLLLYFFAISNANNWCFSGLLALWNRCVSLASVPECSALLNRY